MPTVVAAWVVMVMTAPTITIHICDGSHKPLATTQIPMPMRNGVPDVDRAHADHPCHRSLYAIIEPAAIRGGAYTMRRCAYRRCPQLIPDSEQYCAEHKRLKDKQRGSSTARGYGSAHRREREKWRKLLASGVQWVCPRCGRVVRASDNWDLGHSEDRKFWTGPEHSHCNRSAGAKNSARMREHWD